MNEELLSATASGAAMGILGTVHPAVERREAGGCAVVEIVPGAQLAEVESRAVLAERQRQEAEAKVVALEEKLRAVSRAAREHQDAIQEVQQARLAGGGDGLPLQMTSDGGRAAYEQLLAAESKALLLAQELEIATVQGERDVSRLKAESEAARHQVRKPQGRRVGQGDEEACIMLCAEQAEGLCFERDWHVTELRAAAGVSAAETERLRLGRAAEEEAKAINSEVGAANRCNAAAARGGGGGHDEALRTCLTEEFERERTPVQRQVPQVERQAAQPAARRTPAAELRAVEGGSPAGSTSPKRMSALLAQELGELAAATGEGERRGEDAALQQLRAELEAVRQQHP